MIIFTFRFNYDLVINDYQVPILNFFIIIFLIF